MTAPMPSSTCTPISQKLLSEKVYSVAQIGRTANPVRSGGLLPSYGRCVRPRRDRQHHHLRGDDHADVMAVASLGWAAASFCPTSGSNAALARWNSITHMPKMTSGRSGTGCCSRGAPTVSPPRSVRRACVAPGHCRWRRTEWRVLPGLQAPRTQAREEIRRAGKTHSRPRRGHGNGDVARVVKGLLSSQMRRAHCVPRVKNQGQRGDREPKLRPAIAVGLLAIATAQKLGTAKEL